MADLSLAASSRTASGRHVRALRRQGLVPAVVYGHRVSPASIQADARALERTWRAAGRTHLIALAVDGARPQRVLFREFQVDPRTAHPLHADFFVVNLREKLAADVPLVVVGEAPAVSELKIGQLLQTLTSVRVECLPTDLPAQLNVDVSGLREVDASITVGDLVLPGGVTLSVDPAEMVVKIAPLRVQEVEPEVAAAEVAEAAPAAEAAEPSPAGEGAGAAPGEGNSSG